MIIRIVKMTFSPSKLVEFLEIFNSSKEKIRTFEGCNHLELLNDINNPNIFFTYSHWASEQDLNNYRDSDLFKKTWTKTKALFSEEAEASSLDIIYKN
ncbi:MAG: antibiotic biosynthesis monooxygenase family protein [Bacteroidota bacterium]